MHKKHNLPFRKLAAFQPYQPLLLWETTQNEVFLGSKLSLGFRRWLPVLYVADPNPDPDPLVRNMMKNYLQKVISSKTFLKLFFLAS